MWCLRHHGRAPQANSGTWVATPRREHARFRHRKLVRRDGRGSGRRRAHHPRERRRVAGEHPRALRRRRAGGGLAPAARRHRAGGRVRYEPGPGRLGRPGRCRRHLRSRAGWLAAGWPDGGQDACPQPRPRLPRRQSSRSAHLRELAAPGRRRSATSRPRHGAVAGRPDLPPAGAGGLRRPHRAGVHPYARAVRAAWPDARRRSRRSVRQGGAGARAGLPRWASDPAGGAGGRIHRRATLSDATRLVAWHRGLQL